MEQDLHARDRVGVQDFVLLHDHTSEAEFIENLQKRSKEDLIYVSELEKCYGVLFFKATLSILRF